MLAVSLKRTEIMRKLKICFANLSPYIYGKIKFQEQVLQPFHRVTCSAYLKVRNMKLNI